MLTRSTAVAAMSASASGRKDGAAKVQAKRPSLNLAQRQELLDHDPAPPEVIAAAVDLKEQALLAFGLKDSVVASWIFSKCTYQIPTTAIETAAVTVSGDGRGALLYNPHFFVKLGLEGVKFVLYHEARHLIQRHLYAEGDLLSDKVWELANEVSINHVVMVRQKRTSLPVVETDEVDKRTGKKKTEPTGTDPKAVYKKYAEDLKGQGLDPVDYDKFVETDFSIYAELKRMKNPPTNNPKMAVCIHQKGQPLPGDGQPQPGQGEGGEPVQMDQEGVDAIAKASLEEAFGAAIRGNEHAREELLGMADRSEEATERTQKIWGNLGMHALRGETLATRKVEWWKQWLVDTLESKIKTGARLIYPVKRNSLLTALGLRPMLAHRGPERVKVVLVAIDTSGSMSQEVIDWITQLVGQVDGVEDHWLSFDGVVMPFKPGERVSGGGGTNFQNVVDYAEGRLEVEGKKLEVRPDAVIMVTDGYAAHVTPAEPDKWIWLITDDGDDWPDHHNPQMACHRVVTGDS